MKIIIHKTIVTHATIKNLKECLKFIGITQAELARSSNLSRAYITDIAKGRRYCPEKILTFLNDTIEYLNSSKCSYCSFTMPESDLKDGLCNDCFRLGEMGDFDDINKPVCSCSNSLVTSVGKTGKWQWMCVNCSKTF